ncbi:hypothetical protein QEH52_20005 [Coraliomargarita sp. SDUM461003]|uniref:FHA domain-containing protein n=1 Tax=Thalassobacterium maritimum TaxID=3041265 RepID=A0ABU1B277_9BACT|nr:hypothetical protein [Coraliomargarita sp. SDUM461003]MDQ8209814.1 hypothetical protein [Coraliomargarita sp. SDUM461003]
MNDTRELYYFGENQPLVECSICQSPDRSSRHVILRFQDGREAEKSYTLKNPEDLVGIEEIFDADEVRIEKETGTQKEYGTIILGIYGESYTHISFDSVEETKSHNQSEQDNPITRP